MGQVVTFSKVDDCTSQPVTFNGYPSTSGCLTGLRNKPQELHQMLKPMRLEVNHKLQVTGYKYAFAPSICTG